jgi:MoaA/NifB/PqqE/SkfB family radical SAM enzyme
MINFIKRCKTLITSEISGLPVVVLMPYSGCNCRCLMCNIWKENKNVRTLSLETIAELIQSFRKLNTKWVTLSGGEPLIHPHIDAICRLIKNAKMKLSILSTGMTVSKSTETLLSHTDELILSLDGPPEVHNRIRNIPTAFVRLAEGVNKLHQANPNYRITTRTVIQKENFRHWPEIIETVLSLGIQQCSFLPADVSTSAFNHPNKWETEKQSDILLSPDECDELGQITERLIKDYQPLFDSGFIAESPAKLRKILQYYRGFVIGQFPIKACNAPWVSTVIEADGTVRHCFFHQAMGNIYQDKLEDILNKPESISFRKQLDTNKNPVCEKCVCYLNLKAFSML